MVLQQQGFRVLRRTYRPAAVGAGETKTLLKVIKGARIVWCDWEYLVSADGGATGTIAVQATTAGGAAGGLIAATSVVGTAGSLVNGAGTDLANSGGLLCATDGTIDAVYTPGAGPGATNPQVRVSVAVVYREPLA